MYKKEFAQSIRPAKKSKPDKYSWRLYQRALERGRERVYLMAWNPIDGRVKPDIESLKSGFVSAMGIAIGDKNEDGWFYGRSLSTICRPGGPRHDFAYGLGFAVKDWVDITDWFWLAYERSGRCLFFRNVHEWQQINRNSRKCIYCGKHERREVVTRKIIERNEVWK